MAEGVETESQAVTLRRMGVDFGQGYLWSHPLHSEQVRDWCAVHRVMVAEPR